MPGVVPSRWRAAALFAALAFAPGAARATTVRQHLSIVQLLEESETIARGCEERGEGHTRSVTFPEGLDQHLAHGDTDGPCPGHRE